MVVLSPPSFQLDRTTTMSGRKKRYIAPSATPWDEKHDVELSPAERLVRDSQRSMYEFRHHSFEGDIDFLNSYERDSCPRCGAPAPVKFGKNAVGLRRYRCRVCKATFTPATGTIFDDRKLPLSAWADFIIQALSYESISSMNREDRRSETTTPYWLAKIFSVLEGIQDDVVLSGTVWIDETYWPVARKDALLSSSGKLLRGLSRNQICIGVGIDDGGRSLFVREGFGKTSKRKAEAAFGSHIAHGSTLVHDMEQAHDALTVQLNLKDHRHNAALLKGVPDELNPLEPVNRMCFLLKSFLRSHPGFNRDNLQGYLDLFWVASNEPDSKPEKAAFVLNRAMTSRNTLRFRDYYAKNP